MTTFAGAILPLFESIPLGITSSWTPSRTRPVETTGGYDPAREKSGAVTNEQPTTMLSVALSGAQTRTYLDDYYNTIHFRPLFVDFGPISSAATIPLFIWNAYLHNITLNTIAETSLPDVDISGPALPAVFKALQTKTYNVTAAAVGSPEVAGSYAFTFDVGGVVIPVTGLRARLGFFEPNWRESYKITYEYRTEILTSESGREQRRALRSTPRKTVEFTTTLQRGDWRRFQQDMASWQNRLFVLPEIPREAVFADALGENIQTTSLQSVPAWVQPDVTVVLRNKGKLALRKIEAIEGVTVTFTVGGEAWPAGTTMHPALNGFLGSDTAGSKLTNAVAEIAVSFGVKVGTEIAEDVPAAPVTYNGREVFLTKPNWSNAPQITFHTVLDRVDYDRGITAEFRPVAFNTVLTQSAYTGRDFETIEALVNFFKRLKGQRGEFYCPTDQDDFDFVSAVSGSLNLRVKGIDAFETYAGSSVQKDICIALNDGTFILKTLSEINRITDEDGDDSVLVCTTTFVATLSASQVKRISWMPVHRLSSDQLTIEWLTNAKGQTQITMQTLEDLSGV